MKKFLKLPVILFLLSLMLVACNKEETKVEPTPETPDTPSTVEEETGGTFTFQVASDPAVLNPLYANDRVTLTIQQSLFSPIYSIRDGQKKYFLAESFEQTEDPTIWTLKLKENLKWHDGQPLTAEDIVFTVEATLDEKQASIDYSNFILNGKPIQVEAIDKLTVKFILPEVSAAFEGVMNGFAPIPKHIFENVDDIAKSPLNQKPIGSGPYKFVEMKADEYVILERFDDYYAGAGKLDRLVYRVVKDANTANIALQNGEVSARLVDAQDVTNLEATGLFNMVDFAEGRLYYMAFNTNSKVNQSKEFRQAIAHTINKDELIEAAFISTEYADKANSIFSPDALYQTQDLKSYDYDLERAKELLAASGVNETIRIIYVNGHNVQESLALYAQQQIQQLGLKVELIPFEQSAHTQKTLDPNSDDYEISFGGYIMGSEPDVYKNLFKSDGSFNFARYKNKAFDELWVKGAVETDNEKRKALYVEIQETIAEDVPYLPLAYPKAIIAINKSYAGIEEANPIPISMFEDMSKLYMVK